MRIRTRFLAIVAVFSCFAIAQNQPTLTPELRKQIDQVAQDTLAKTGVPSASVAIVNDGKIAYVQAYGDARLEPKTPAKSSMRYSIGSISKQFTAAAVLLLQQEGKLSLDDKVAKYIPDLTRANEVSIRQLLSHTSGYSDYWPQDYVPPFMLTPITAKRIMDLWARKPLDFDPGTKWQYSNTNYVIAGTIIEKVSGMPLLQYLQQKVFTPAGMKNVANIDQEKLGDTDATGYMRYALGPTRVAPKEGTGWLFAMGELAMTAEDLAKWDVSLIAQSVMSPASYKEMEREVVLANGLGAEYGLGVDVEKQSGHRSIGHSGEVSGFTAQNLVFPDEKVAVAVLTNQDAAPAAGRIARQIVPLLFTTSDNTTEQKTAQARSIFEDLQHGKVNRSLFTDNANAYFNDATLKDFAAGLAPLGEPASFTQTSEQLRGGMRLRVYSVKFLNRSLRAWTYEMPDGKLEQYQIAPAD